MVYLITGKAGAGKSHYAETLKEELELEGFKVKWIDGDKFREHTGNHDYTVAGRRRNLNDAARLAGQYEKEGFIVLVSFIAPMIHWRQEMRMAWLKSIVVYIPGGTLWEGTTYQPPREEELGILENK